MSFSAIQRMISLPPPGVLAQQNPAGESMQILWILGWLVLTVVLLIIVALILRRFLVGKRRDEPIGLTLGDLRKMRDEGHLSNEEFEATRQTLIARRHATDQQTAAESNPETPGPAAPPTEAASARPDPEADDLEDDLVELGEELLDRSNFPEPGPSESDSDPHRTEGGRDQPENRPDNPEKNDPDPEDEDHDKGQKR